MVTLRVLTATLPLFSHTPVVGYWFTRITPYHFTLPPVTICGSYGCRTFTVCLQHAVLTRTRSFTRCTRFHSCLTTLPGLHDATTPHCYLRCVLPIHHIHTQFCGYAYALVYTTLCCYAVLDLVGLRTFRSRVWFPHLFCVAATFTAPFCSSFTTVAVTYFTAFGLGYMRLRLLRIRTFCGYICLHLDRCYLRLRCSLRLTTTFPHRFSAFWFAPWLVVHLRFAPHRLVTHLPFGSPRCTYYVWFACGYRTFGYAHGSTRLYYTVAVGSLPVLPLSRVFPAQFSCSYLHTAHYRLVTYTTTTVVVHIYVRYVTHARILLPHRTCRICRPVGYLLTTARCRCTFARCRSPVTHTCRLLPLRLPLRGSLGSAGVHTRTQFAVGYLPRVYTRYRFCRGSAGSCGWVTVLLFHTFTVTFTTPTARCDSVLGYLHVHTCRVRFTFTYHHIPFSAVVHCSRSGWFRWLGYRTFVYRLDYTTAPRLPVTTTTAVWLPSTRLRYRSLPLCTSLVTAFTHRRCAFTCGLRLRARFARTAVPGYLPFTVRLLRTAFVPFVVAGWLPTHVAGCLPHTFCVRFQLLYACLPRLGCRTGFAYTAHCGLRFTTLPLRFLPRLPGLPYTVTGSGCRGSVRTYLTGLRVRLFTHVPGSLPHGSGSRLVVVWFLPGCRTFLVALPVAFDARTVCHVPRAVRLHLFTFTVCAHFRLVLVHHGLDSFYLDSALRLILRFAYVRLHIVHRLHVYVHTFVVGYLLPVTLLPHCTHYHGYLHTHRDRSRFFPAVPGYHTVMVVTQLPVTGYLPAVTFTVRCGCSFTRLVYRFSLGSVAGYRLRVWVGWFVWLPFCRYTLPVLPHARLPRLFTAAGYVYVTPRLFYITARLPCVTHYRGYVTCRCMHSTATFRSRCSSIHALPAFTHTVYVLHTATFYVTFV